MAKTKMLKLADVSTDGIVALYARVSTDKQREEGYSVEIQKERLEAYAKSMYPDAKTEFYIDDGHTGASLNRPAMTRMTQDIKNQKIASVVVVKLDRLSRSQKDTLYLIEDMFLPHGVAFISMNESFNTSTPFGRAMIGILSVFAQLERENIFERTRGGMQKRVESGLWMGGGRVPFGYDYDKSKGILIPNSDAETVRRIYDLYIEGYALQKIADMCGLKYERLAHQIIIRKSNTGYITYNGVEYKGQHEPIVSLETYDKAMAMMLDRSSKYYSSTSDHLLTGLVVCGKCGAKMRYQKWGKAGNKFVCYSQQSSKKYLIKDPNCDNEKPFADEIEDAVIQDLFLMCKNTVEQGERVARTMAPVELFQEQYDVLAKKLKRLYALYATDGNEVLLDLIEELKHQSAIVQKKILIETEKNVWEKQATELREQIKDIEKLWEHMTIQEKRNILRSVIGAITVTNQSMHVDYKI